MQKTNVQFASISYEIKLDSNWGFFATHSISNNRTTKSLETIPKNFTESFRVVNYVSPHLSKILWLHFEIYQFPDIEKITDRLISFFQILSNAIDNQVYFKPNI